MLLRAIFRQPLYSPPPLGKKPIFSKLDETENSELRLPDVELDGYSLESGIVSNQKYPDTFHIPSPLQRNSLESSDIVKLHFKISRTRSLEDIEGERMWVKSISRRGPYYIGELDNDPIARNEDNSPLKFGDQIIFLPEHVIAIYSEDE